MFTSSTKREIFHFHVVVVQRRQRNVPKACCTCKVFVLPIEPIAASPLSFLRLFIIQGPFTWKWGTPGRWDNPLRWCKKKQPSFACNLTTPLSWGAISCYFSIIAIFIGIPGGSLCGGETDNWMVAKHTNKKKANHVFWRLMLFYTHLLLLLQPSVLWPSIVTFHKDAKPPPKWIWCITNPTPARRVIPPWNVYMAKFYRGWEGYPVCQTGLPAMVGHRTYHVNVIKLKWEIIRTGGLPHLSGLPHLPGVPHCTSM